MSTEHSGLSETFLVILTHDLIPRLTLIFNECKAFVEGFYLNFDEQCRCGYQVVPLIKNRTLCSHNNFLDVGQGLTMSK